MSVLGQKSKSSQSFLEMLGWMSFLARVRSYPRKWMAHIAIQSVLSSLSTCSGISVLKKGLKQKDH